MLCWTKTFVTITSAFKTFLSRFESLLVKKLVADDCFFEDSTLALCDSFLQWSVTSFRPWWLQDSFLQQGIQKTSLEKRVTWNTLNRVRFRPCLIKLALIKFTLCCCHYVFLICKGKARKTVSLTLMSWRWKKPRWSEHISIPSLIILPYSVWNKVENTAIAQEGKQTLLFSTKARWRCGK